MVSTVEEMLIINAAINHVLREGSDNPETLRRRSDVSAVVLGIAGMADVFSATGLAAVALAKLEREMPLSATSSNESDCGVIADLRAALALAWPEIPVQLRTHETRERMAKALLRASFENERDATALVATAVCAGTGGGDPRLVHRTLRG
jgi:hypothetical protein